MKRTFKNSLKIRKQNAKIRESPDTGCAKLITI